MFGWLIALGALATALVQITFLSTIFGGWPVPNVTLILLLILTFDRKFTPATIWAVIGGLVLDVALPGRFFYLPIFLFLGLALQMILARIGGRPGFANIALLGISAITIVLLIESLVFGLSGWSHFLLSWVTNIVAGAILTYGYLLIRNRFVDRRYSQD